MQLAEFTVLMAKLKARYGTQRTDPKLWTATVLSYFEVLGNRNPKAVRMALDDAWRHHPKFFPTLGELSELVKSLTDRAMRQTRTDRLLAEERVGDNKSAKGHIRDIIADLGDKMGGIP